MKPPFEPELLPYDNTMERFMEEFKSKQPISEAELIQAEVDLFESMSRHSVLSPDECKQSLVQALRELPPRKPVTPPEPKRKWGWKTLFWLVLGFALGVWLWYEALN